VILRDQRLFLEQLHVLEDGIPHRRRNPRTGRRFSVKKSQDGEPLSCSACSADGDAIDSADPSACCAFSERCAKHHADGRRVSPNACRAILKANVDDWRQYCVKAGPAMCMGALRSR